MRLYLSSYRLGARWGSSGLPYRTMRDGEDLLVGFDDD
jgi:hypothetical protein